MTRHAVVAVLVSLSLVACKEGSSEAPPHDHSGHDHAKDHAKEAPAPAEAPAKAYKVIPASKDYPLATCVVSGDKLGGDMGPPIAIEYEGREIQFCCDGCVDDFLKDPKAYLAKLDAAKK